MENVFENWKTLIPAEFADNSKVWIYQAHRPFGTVEAIKLEAMLEEFIANWKTHGSPVKGYGNLFFGQFLVLMADDTVAHVGGCSTDDSLHFIQELENTFNVRLLDRLNLAFLIRDKVELLPTHQITNGIEKGFLNPDTLYFNNTVVTKKTWLENWIIPLKDSWLANRFPRLSNNFA